MALKFSNHTIFTTEITFFLFLNFHFLKVYQPTRSSNVAGPEFEFH